MTIAQALIYLAAQFNIDANLVLALIEVESSNNKYAYRVEPHYRYLWDVEDNSPFRHVKVGEELSAPDDFPYTRGVNSRDSEWWGQKSSWGPLQIMGAVTREYGFKGPFPELCGDLGVEYGIRHLAYMKKRFYSKYLWDGVIAAYNAGRPRLDFDGKYRNQTYVDKVNAAWERHRVNLR